MTAPRIALAELPDLATPVATSGTLAMTELGGRDELFEMIIGVVVVYRGRH